MAAIRYVICTCGHKDIGHEASAPHACRHRECGCLAFFSAEVAAKLWPPEQ